MSTSDAQLVALAQAGELRAFDELMARHQQRVFALAYHMLADADDAADVQQETFVRAWQALRKFRRDAEFSTWLHRITVNLCLSRRRSADKLRSKSEAGNGWVFEDSLFHSAEPAAVACLERRELAAEVRRVLIGMPAHHRALIVLREIEGRPFEEIARILRCSERSARTRACRARGVLRQRLQPYLAGDS